MALFKISKGNSSNLSSQTLTEGFCWFTPDDGKFYIDATKNNVLTRIPLNAKKADTADAWTTGQKVYVNLGSADKTKTISGGSATAQEIGVDGTLPIANGGTGAINAIDARTNLGLGTLATKSTIGNHSYTPAGTISRPTFTGSSLTSTGTMIPAGVNSASAVTISPKTTSVYSITSVGSVTAGSAAVLTMTVSSNEVLSFSWTTNTPTSVTIPTRTQVTGLWNGYNTGVNNTYAAAQTFEGATCNVSVTGTPAGTISIPTFTGTAKTLSHTVS